MKDDNDEKPIADKDDVYDGELLKGLPHGEGSKKFKDGSIYKGNWRHGKMHGKGR
jgi:hypothetical protein